jgi:hypothetical protein
VTDSESTQNSDWKPLSFESTLRLGVAVCQAVAASVPPPGAGQGAGGTAPTLALLVRGSGSLGQKWLARHAHSSGAAIDPLQPSLPSAFNGVGPPAGPAAPMSPAGPPGPGPGPGGPNNMHAQATDDATESI